MKNRQNRKSKATGAILKRSMALGFAFLLAFAGLWSLSPGQPEGSAGAAAPLRVDWEAFPPDPVRFEPPETEPPPLESYRAPPEDFAYDAERGLGYVKNIVIAYFARGTSEEEKRRAVDAVGGEVVGRADAVGRWTVLLRSGGDLPALEDACAALERQPGVTAATIDHVLRLSVQAVPDPWKGGGFDDETQNRWAAETIRAPEAWAYNPYITQTVRVGMVDQGVRASHEELSGSVQLLTNINLPDWDDSGQDHVYSYTSVPTWHGTGVASLMAAKADNGKGLAGVAPEAQVFAFNYARAITELFPEEALIEQQMSILLDGLIAAVVRGAKAVNYSTGMIPNNGMVELSAPEIAEHARVASLAIAQLLSYGYPNFVAVQSAGNQPQDARHNGLFASVTPLNTQLAQSFVQQGITPEMIWNRILIVGAAEKHGSYNFLQQCSFTATGYQVSLYAPGRSVFFAAADSDEAYLVQNGSSFAAPLVTATAARMLTARPDLDGGQIGQLLKSDLISPRVVHIYNNPSTSTMYPLLDCARAMEAVMPTSLQAASGAELEVLPALGRVENVPPGTAAAALEDSLQALNGTLDLPKAQETPDAYMATGDPLYLVKPGGQSIAYKIVVEGDINGDGLVDGRDQFLWRLYQAGLWSPAAAGPEFAAAADKVDEDYLYEYGMLMK
ncbi:MAG: S8/S53 family peptidase [Oscillospiraceae bacterium]|nr:S8/S53 family peptidase [Oscillospiraceae bacterium]